MTTNQPEARSTRSTKKRPVPTSKELQVNSEQKDAKGTGEMTRREACRPGIKINAT